MPCLVQCRICEVLVWFERDTDWMTAGSADDICDIEGPGNLSLGFRRPGSLRLRVWAQRTWQLQSPRLDGEGRQLAWGRSTWSTVLRYFALMIQTKDEMSRDLSEFVIIKRPEGRLYANCSVGKFPSVDIFATFFSVCVWCWSPGPYCLLPQHATCFGLQGEPLL